MIECCELTENRDSINNLQCSILELHYHSSQRFAFYNWNTVRILSSLGGTAIFSFFRYFFYWWKDIIIIIKCSYFVNHEPIMNLNRIKFKWISRIQIKTDKADIDNKLIRIQYTLPFCVTSFKITQPWSSSRVTKLIG